MANWAVAPVDNLVAYNTPILQTAAIVFATDGSTVGATLTLTKSAEKCIVILSNTASGAAHNVTITKGNGRYASNDDMVVALDASEVKVIMLETELWKQMTGTYKGKILFSGTTDNFIRAIQGV